MSMRRSINTIPKDEYDILLRKAVHRMVKKFRILSDEENSNMIKADNHGNYEKAEKHDFNSRALSLMANMFYTYYDIRTGENED